MLRTHLKCTGSAHSNAIRDLISTSLNLADGIEITAGLPAGSRLWDQAGVIVGGTPCMVPLFTDAMTRNAETTGCDVLVARHGAYPEILNPVLWDAVVWAGRLLVPLTDYLLYVEEGEDLWLVPSNVGPYLRLTSTALHLENDPPFITWHQRCEGVCLGAKRIIRATRPDRGGR